MPFDLDMAVHNAQQRLRRALKEDVARHLVSYSLRNAGIMGATHVELSVEPVTFHYYMVDKPASNYPTRVRRTAELLCSRPQELSLFGDPMDFTSVPYVQLPGLWVMLSATSLNQDVCSVQLLQVMA